MASHLRLPTYSCRILLSFCLSWSDMSTWETLSMGKLLQYGVGASIVCGPDRLAFSISSTVSAC